MTAPDFSVGLVQMSCGSDSNLNRTLAIDGIREAAGEGAEIVCLQELFAFEYFCQVEDARFFDLAEKIPGPSTEQFSSVAKELGVVLIVPVFEKRTAGLYHNSAVVIDVTGELLGSYRKLHIPDDPQYFEKFYFTPGDYGYSVFKTSVAMVGVLICWDQWYPEAARLMALQGAEVVFYPSSIGGLASESPAEALKQLDAWRTIQRGHAIANGFYVATVNRVGHEGEPGIDFWGRSIVSEASGEKTQVLVAQCSRSLLENQRRNWPFLRDRRIDTYGALTERFIDPTLLIKKSSL